MELAFIFKVTKRNWSDWALGQQERRQQKGQEAQSGGLFPGPASGQGADLQGQVRVPEGKGPGQGGGGRGQAASRSLLSFPVEGERAERRGWQEKMMRHKGGGVGERDFKSTKQLCVLRWPQIHMCVKIIKSHTVNTNTNSRILATSGRKKGDKIGRRTPKDSL